jgi:hypothetical protein
METPAVGGMLPGMATPEMYQAARAERELYERNKPLTDEELDALLPGPEQVRWDCWGLMTVLAFTACVFAYLQPCSTWLC